MECPNTKIPAFHPLFFISSPDLQTILGRYWPGPQIKESGDRHTVRLIDGDAIVLLENRCQSAKGNILLLHGLGGDAHSPYMRRLAFILSQSGWRVFRMNHRGAGDGCGMARGLYHAGRSEDVCAAVGHIEQKYPDTITLAVGFSLSGNMVLKLAGENPGQLPTSLRAILAVCPPIDLALCARTIIQPRNRIYDRRFVRLLKANVRERARELDAFSKYDLSEIKNLYQFDDQITAPASGFQDAKAYYKACSAKHYWAGINLPTLVIASDDDPFIPKETFKNIPENTAVTLHMTKGGGHLGFLQNGKNMLGTYRWMDSVILDWANAWC